MKHCSNGLAKTVRVTTVMLTVFALVFGSFSFSFGAPIPVAQAAATSCSTVTLVSGPSTQTAGYTETQPTSDANALIPAGYSLGQFIAASSTETNALWVVPATDSSFASSSAVWVSTNPSWPGGTDNTEGSAQNNQWRLFQDSFTLPVGSTVTDATLWYATDNAAAVYLNGSVTPVATTNASTSEDVYGLTPDINAQNFSSAFTTAFSPVGGVNTLSFVVRNWGIASSTVNPTGLLYTAVIHYCAPGPTGTIGGTVTGGTSGQGVLTVNSITATQTTATADGTFANGWKYIFHITDPTNEPNLTLKFGDWFDAAASSTIRAGGNIQISSLQASSTSPVVITAANLYANPSLLLVSDLDPTAVGRQVDVVVEVKVPVGSVNGAYSTAYGVQTLP